MTPYPDAPARRTSLRAGVAARLAQVGISLLAQVVVLFGAAGRLDWVWGWAYLGVYLAGIAIIGAFLLPRSPETIAERGRAMGQMRGWDRIVGGLWGLAQFLLVPLVAGLDARFGWTGTIGEAAQIGGGIAFAAGLLLFGWAMVANAWFSTAVRIQFDRGHTVCRSGPYRIVRHPGYVGTILQSLGMPVLLGSTWALLPGVAAIGLIASRTVLEDRTLLAELPGYDDYTRAVRFRLLPGIW